MLQRTCCSICLSINKRTINIYGTDLQNVYEKLAEFKAKAELCFLCYICCARLRQVANLQNAVTSCSQSPKTLVCLVKQNIENETIPYHVVLTKKEPPEFDVQERHLEHDDVTIKPEIENSEYIDKIEIIENSIDNGEEEETAIQSKNAIDETTQDSQVVYSVYTQRKQKVPRVVIVRLSQSEMNKYGQQRLTTHLAVEDPKDSGGPKRNKGIKHEERANTDDCEGRGHASAAQSSKTPHTCHVCLKNYSTRRHLLRHMKTNICSFSCDTCSKNFCTKDGLTVHIKMHTGEGNKQKNIDQIQDASKAETKNPHKCDVCSKRFPTNSLLVIHARTHTGEKSFGCDVCSKKFSQKSHLSIHKRIHTGYRPYVCDICSKQFSYKSSLTVHKRIHNGHKPYSCAICSKRFTNKSHLNVHMPVHTGLKPFTCNVCSKSFTLKTHLNVHMRTHTGDKPYFCYICSKQYAQNIDLQRHLLIHTGNKAFSCEVCSKKFTQKRYLVLHSVVHTGIKNYTCEVCAKKFASKSELNAHNGIHTGYKPHTCDLCSKSFSSKKV